jgi:DNA repair protein RadD
MLRAYQQRAIDQLYDWMGENEGNPCLVLPTGAGKSHVIAELCREAVQEWPETRILMLTHVKELIEQNAAKLRGCWPNAPMGIYSASIGKRQLGEPITFAGIQSIRGKASRIGHIDLVIIDECHLVSHKDEGGYRTLINQLAEINPRLRVIGLTASPFRLGHGLITDKPAIFDALIEPTSIEELVHLGHLSVLKSKATRDKLDTSGVKKRGGDYIESQLQAAVNTDPINRGVVSEIIEIAGDRKAWLVFCTGVDHAQAVCDCLVSRGVAAACLTGKTSKAQRDAIIRNFKAGRLRALTNVSVLTTGFDYPDIDLIAMLRPTLSPSLYLQMAGRGLRPKSHTDHCLVLDFAGVVETHGPITAIQPPSKTGESGGEPPTKECPNCKEIVAIMCKTCPSCGEPLEVKEKEAPQFFLREDDIMGLHPQEMDVTDWQWRVHTSRTSGLDMPAVTYYGGMLEAVTEYFPINNGGYASERALKTIGSIAMQSGADQSKTELNEIVDSLNSAKAPAAIKYKKDGKFFRVLVRQW